MKQLKIVMLLAAFGVASAAHANHRMANQYGFHLGLLGDPFPTLVGFNLNYNALDFMRVTAGYGSISGSGLSITTLGGGIRAMHPEWNFTPTVGLNFASVTVSGTLQVGSSSVGGFSASGSHLYTNLGFDWQAESGFNFGAGMNLSLGGAGSLPYINLGWYF